MSATFPMLRQLLRQIVSQQDMCHAENTQVLIYDHFVRRKSLSGGNMPEKEAAMVLK